MIIKIPKRNKTASGIAPQIVNYHCHMVEYPPFSKAQRLYQPKSVDGFEPTNEEISEVSPQSDLNQRNKSFAEICLTRLGYEDILYKTCATIVTQDTKEVNH